jgi:UDP-GlcNAc:undecaprenyl-phosphate GlcNAc-1-phosphate transferase
MIWESAAHLAVAQVDTPVLPPAPPTRLSIFEGYVGVLIVSFLVAVIATPIMRRLALANNVVDQPGLRKVHRQPVAYLGGVAVYLGLLAGIFYSFLAIRFPDLVEFHNTRHLLDADEAIRFPVPISILLGMTVIMLVGVIDDVTGISPRVKIGGQLFAAAALAVDNVGVRLASGLLRPVGDLVGNPSLLYHVNLPFSIPGMGSVVPIDLVYWIGTAIIAVGVLGLCNASNLIDGLDGLLSGTTAISAVGLLVISLGLAFEDDGPRDSQRIILCLAVLGACLGFLPHNFNPATIFLGDAGSLLLGFMTCVIIMMLGDTGKTHLVAAGLIVYALPIIDTTLAIVRRKLEGKPISSGDDQHLHHMLKRALGVKGAVFVLYGIAATFAALGASLTLIRARGVYFLALVMAAYIGITAIKISRKRTLEARAAAHSDKVAAGLVPPDGAPAAPAPPAPDGGHAPAEPTRG